MNLVGTTDSNCRVEKPKIVYSKSEMFFAFFTLLVGVSIYLLFRSRSLLAFRWLEIVGLKDFIITVRTYCGNICLPEFVIYCLPDGLWSLSYVLFMDSIWRGGKLGFLFVQIIPVIGAISELLQKYHVLDGCYDTCDFICYLFPLVVYDIFILKYRVL